MSTSQGTAGSGNRHYETEAIPSVLRGRLASDHEEKVYPENRCALCERAGVIEQERCFHKHWPEVETRGNGR